MTKKKRDLKIIFTPEAQKELDKAVAKDPSLGEAMRNLFAAMRQAHQAVNDGQYNDFGDAMEAITGERPERIEED